MAHSGSTNTATEDLKRAAEHSHINSQSTIELLSLSQKAQAEAAIQQEQSQAEFIWYVKVMFAAQTPPMRIVSGNGGDDPPNRPRTSLACDDPDGPEPHAGSSVTSHAPSRPAKKTGHTPPGLDPRRRRPR